MDATDLIRDYYRCFKDRDRERLRELLTPDFRHVSPFGAYDDRDRMLEEIWPHVGKIWAADIEIFGQGPEYMVRYRHAGESSARLAEYIRFEGDRIAEIEVYPGRGAAGGGS
ncbi:MAG: nuclear transport factor 2 family protein [Alphaproteobacteria bacterium]